MLSRHKTVALEILARGVVVPFACDRCSVRGVDCIKMADDNKKLKCAECTRVGKPCVSVSWESLRRTRDNLEDELSRDQEEADRHIAAYLKVKARINRKRKVLEQAQTRAAKKFKCLIEELEAEGEDMTATVIDASAFEADLGGPIDGNLFADGLGETVAAGAGSSPVS